MDKSSESHIISKRNKMGTLKNGVEFVIEHGKLPAEEAKALRQAAECQHVIDLITHLTGSRDNFDTPQRIYLISSELIDVFTSRGATNKETFAAVAEMFFVMSTINPDVKTYDQIHAKMNDCITRLDDMVNATLARAKPDLERTLAEFNDPMAEHVNLFKKAAVENGNEGKSTEGR